MYIQWYEYIRHIYYSRHYVRTYVVPYRNILLHSSSILWLPYRITSMLERSSNIFKKTRGIMTLL